MSRNDEADAAEIPRLLNVLPQGTLDAVVAGHTHFKVQDIVNGTPVIESGAYGKVVGVLHIFKNHSQPPKFDPFIDVVESKNEPDVTALMQPYRDNNPRAFGSEKTCLKTDLQIY
jgi:2',3'-cyclic-nucleotide 2'-phosphodiesterase (5'-nucleotidase family)